MRMRAAITIAIGAALLLGGGAPVSSEDASLEERAIIPAVAMDAGESAQQTALRDAEARWRSTGIRDHVTTTRIIVFGPLQVRAIELRDGEAALISERCSFGTQEIACPVVDPADYTVEGLFRTIRTRLASDPAPEPVEVFPPGTPYLQVEYDAERGFPRRISYGLSLVADSDVTILVEEVRPLP